MKANKIYKSNFKSHLYHSIQWCIMSRYPNNQTDQTKLITKKTWNPYESWYGPDCHIEVNKPSFLRCYTCVSNMIEHIVSETKRVFKVTPRETSCLLYCDALSLMAEKETRKWMKQIMGSNLYLTWNGFIFQNHVLKRYRCHPPVNSPELCNLDSSINKYSHKAVGCHARYTHSL